MDFLTCGRKIGFGIFLFVKKEIIEMIDDYYELFENLGLVVVVFSV